MSLTSIRSDRLYYTRRVSSVAEFSEIFLYTIQFVYSVDVDAVFGTENSLLEFRLIRLTSLPY